MITQRPIIFKDYCLLERVSVGGMAEVYRARPFNAPTFNRFLAVKRILPNLAEDREFIEMFIDEAKIAIQLNHPNVCQMYELGRLHDSYYIVMEFISGRDLLQIQNRFRKERRIMAVTQAAFIVAQICEGLDYAHRKVDDEGRPMNIIHRDISPQNILVGFDGIVKVIDFGIARAATRTGQTQAGVLKGKFGYMSPEQASGKQVDHRSDIFAVGTLFWELLTARRLFHGESDYATLEKVKLAQVRPPSEKNRNVPPEIDAIVAKALSRDRDVRYQHAGEMARDLREFLGAVQPPYSDRILSRWMLTAFPEKATEEREKVDLFRGFVTPEDVRRFNENEFDADVEELDLDDLGADLEEATRIYDPSAGAEGEVFAALAGDSDVGATMVIGSTPGQGLAEVTPAAAGTAPPSLPLRPRVGESSGAWKNWVLGLLLLAAFGGIGYALWEQTRTQPGTELRLTLDPVIGTEVLIDGVARTDAMRASAGGWVLADVEPGLRILEVRHPEHEPFMAEVDFVAGEAPQVDVVLVPLAGGEARLTLTLTQPEAEVWVNGTLQEGEGEEREVALPSAEVSHVEVYLAGHFVEALRFEPARDEELERRVSLRAALGTLVIGSEPAGVVFLDGVERGVTSPRLQVGELELHRPHQLEIRPRRAGFRPYQQTIVFDGVPDLRVHPRLRRIGERDEGPPELAFGFLSVEDEGMWHRILVDGRDTGLVTPLRGDEVLALRTGERHVELIRAGQRRSATVMIGEEETVVLRTSDLDAQPLP